MSTPIFRPGLPLGPALGVPVNAGILGILAGQAQRQRAMAEAVLYGTEAARETGVFIEAESSATFVARVRELTPDQRRRIVSRLRGVLVATLAGIEDADHA